MLTDKSLFTLHYKFGYLTHEKATDWSDCFIFSGFGHGCSTRRTTNG
ncbi:Uncharacterised protein [Yersinia enterocolitica]|nr:Uncharacterised protein [Yersinia enterocolitica]